MFNWLANRWRPLIDRREFSKGTARALAAATVCKGLPPAAARTEPASQAAEAIPTRALRKTGLELPVLGYGGAALLLALIPAWAVDFQNPELAMSLIATDATRARQFYVEGLGLIDKGEQTAPGMRMFLYGCGGATVKVRVYDVDPPGRSPAILAENGFRFLTIPVAGFDQVLTRLANLGFPAPVVQTQDGVRTGLAQDGDGNVVELIDAATANRKLELGIIVSPENLAAAQQFYAVQLGLPAASAVTGPSPAPGTTEYRYRARDTVFRVFAPPGMRTTPRDPVGGELGYHYITSTITSDVVALHDQLMAAGCQIASPLAPFGTTAMLFMIYGPGGAIHEFVGPLSSSPVLVVSPTTVQVPEGGSATFTARLLVNPTTTVTVTLTRTAGDTDLAIAPATLTFTPSTGTQPQTATITAAADDDQVNGTATFTLSATGATRTVTVTAQEQEPGAVPPALMLAPTSVDVPELGSATSTLRLSAAPSANVVVSLKRASGDSSLSISPATLTFTPANWSQPQAVTVAGAADADTMNGSALFSASATGYATVYLSACERDAGLTAEDWANLRMTRELYAPARHQEDPSDPAGQILDAMALEVHNGKLYCSASYVPASGNPQESNAKILVKDSAGSPWRAEYQAGNWTARLACLRSVSFQRDQNGNELDPPVRILLCGTGAWDAWDRDGVYVLMQRSEGVWERSRLSTQLKTPQGVNHTEEVRVLGDHLDLVANRHLVFAPSGNGCLYSGIYNAESGSVVWNPDPEIHGSEGRGMSFTQANGVLYMCLAYQAGDPERPCKNYGIWRRNDGWRNPVDARQTAPPTTDPQWTWIRVPEWEDPLQPGRSLRSGQIRGVTAIPDPAGGGHQVLALHWDAPDCLLERVDLMNGYHATVELNTKTYFSQQWGNGGNVITLGYADWSTAAHPVTGQAVHLIGVWGVYPPYPNGETASDLGLSSWFMVRTTAAAYNLVRIWDQDRPITGAAYGLRGCRSIRPSPFPEEAGRTWYFCGFDGTNTSGPEISGPQGWIYKGAVITEIAIPLAAGYTLIALPLDAETPLTAEGLAQQINAQGGTCTGVIAYDAAAGAFVTHPAGTAVSNFTIEVGKGYFVRCAAASTWRARGLRFIASSGAVTLKAGYNLVGLPVEPSPAGKYTAEGAGIEINAQGGGATQIVRYDETRGQFVTHPVGTALENFTLELGQGYFVRCTKGSVWTVSRR